jgi:hypothetical protein
MEERGTQKAMLGMRRGRVQRGAQRYTQEGQIQRLQAIPSPCQPTVSEGCNPQQPQVDDSIGQKVRGSVWLAGYTF